MTTNTINRLLSVAEEVNELAYHMELSEKQVRLAELLYLAANRLITDDAIEGVVRAGIKHVAGLYAWCSDAQQLYSLKMELGRLCDRLIDKAIVLRRCYYE